MFEFVRLDAAAALGVVVVVAVAVAHTAVEIFVALTFASDWDSGVLFFAAEFVDVEHAVDVDAALAAAAVLDVANAVLGVVAAAADNASPRLWGYFDFVDAAA